MSPLIVNGDGVSIAVVMASFLLAQTEKVPAIAVFILALVAGFILA
jgi:hypothetical protein